MNTDSSVTGPVAALWLTVAILAGGYARTRNRSAWNWFILTMFLGPIAAFLLVTWPPLPNPGSGESQRFASVSDGGARD